MTPPPVAKPVERIVPGFKPAEIRLNSDQTPEPLPVLGSSFVMLDSGTERFPDVETMLKVLSDEALFGNLANAKYQPERNKKYLKVTLALMEIRKYLRGDEKNAVLAPKKIEEWLSDADLLGDTVVAHQARVNLIKVLKRAPQDPAIDGGVKGMLEALSKNYAPKAAAPKPAEAAEETKPKEPSELLAELTDAKLFGDKFAAYDAKRNKEYLAVTLALLEIKKFVRGDAADPEAAKTKIAVWLNDYALLTDAVPTQARKNLIQTLESAKGPSETWNQGVAAIVATLKAKYTPAPSEPPAEPEPPKEPPKSEAKPKEKPKEEAPKEPEKGPEKPKEAEKPKKEEPKPLQASYLFSKFTFATKETREDTDASLVKTIIALLRPAVDPLQMKDPGYTLSCEMQVKINNNTGEVFEVLFTDLKVQGKITVDETESALQNMAERFHTRYRFKRGKDDKGPVTVIGIPLDFKKK